MKSNAITINKNRRKNRNHFKLFFGIKKVFGCDLNLNEIYSQSITVYISVDLFYPFFVLFFGILF